MFRGAQHPHDSRDACKASFYAVQTSPAVHVVTLLSMLSGVVLYAVIPSYVAMQQCCLQGSSCGFSGPVGAADMATALGFYYQRQSSQEAQVSVSVIGTEVRRTTQAVTIQRLQMELSGANTHSVLSACPKRREGQEVNYTAEQVQQC
jgi:hypothetical protein